MKRLGAAFVGIVIRGTALDRLYQQVVSMRVEYAMMKRSFKMRKTLQIQLRASE
jgi:hypothetical protein